jgi:hypothetical protein
MPRGGYRPGAGRPRKTDATTKAVVKAKKAAAKPDPVEAEPVVLADGQVSPLEYLLSVVNDTGLDASERMRAAVAAAPYVHARASDIVAAKGKKEQKQEAAETVAASGKFAPRGGPRLAVNND